MKENIINTNSGIFDCSYFNEIYHEVNKEMIANGSIVDSRNGKTSEILNAKLVFRDPKKRCVGGSERGINVFFLLAEAMWIFEGKKDLSFLKIFNSRMGDFSDGDDTFHAPYGFRLRNWGKPSRVVQLPFGSKGGKSDQIKSVLNLLNSDPSTRRAVASIWNPGFDMLNDIKTKDIPCNDILMWKVREGKLYLTVQNRSNDLHWGVPTNLFQFSFLNEVMAKILNLEVGHQVHNSQSLHFYLDNEIHRIMSESDFSDIDLYKHSKNIDFDFSFLDTDSSVQQKLNRLDSFFNKVISTVWNYYQICVGPNRVDVVDFYNQQHLKDILEDSKYFHFVLLLLLCYVFYSTGERDSDSRLQTAMLITDFSKRLGFENSDIALLAINFFASRLRNYEYLAKLEDYCEIEHIGRY